MKKILLTILLACNFYVYSQNENTKFKPGIYINFNEFKNNSPSFQLEGNIVEDIVRYGNLGDRENMKTYLLKIPKQKSKEIGEVFGFSDGYNFYVASYPHSIYDYAFYRIEYLGNKYHYFECLKSTSDNMLLFIKNVIDLKTGEIKMLNRNVLKNILSDNTDLLEKFKNQENKYTHLKEYLIIYDSSK
jgi:hypothetical protein